MQFSSLFLESHTQNAHQCLLYQVKLTEILPLLNMSNLRQRKLYYFNPYYSNSEKSRRKEKKGLMKEGKSHLIIYSASRETKLEEFALDLCQAYFLHAANEKHVVVIATEMRYR